MATVNRDSLWLVVAVAAAWIGFLLGYAASSHTGAKPAAAVPAAGGYGVLPQKGAAKPQAQEAKKRSNRDSQPAVSR